MSTPYHCLSFPSWHISSHSQAGSLQPHPGPAAPAPSPSPLAPSCPSCNPAGAGEGGQDMQAAGYPLIALAAQWRRGGGGAPDPPQAQSWEQGRDWQAPPQPPHMKEVQVSQRPPFIHSQEGLSSERENPRGGASRVNGTDHTGLARVEAAPRGGPGLRGQWGEGSHDPQGQEAPAQARGPPSLDMPTSKHFCSRQY